MTMTIDIETAVAYAMDEYEDRYEAIPESMRDLIADDAVTTVSDWYDMTGRIRTDFLEIVSDLVALYKTEEA